MMINTLLFEVLPYVVIAVEIVASVWRYVRSPYKFSTLSSEFLESRELFWGSVPWHYGILVVLVGHLVAFLFPRHIMLWNAVPVRLLILEVTALVFAILAAVGLITLIHRRMTNARVRAVTTRMDIFVLLLLLVQVASGLGIALTLRWGSNWYVAALVPYLRSVFTFHPNIAYVESIHWLVKVHIVNAFVIVGVLPFTRLVHFLILPIPYLWRPYQLVIWNKDQKVWRGDSRRT